MTKSSRTFDEIMWKVLSDLDRIKPEDWAWGELMTPRYLFGAPVIPVTKDPDRYCTLEDAYWNKSSP